MHLPARAASLAIMFVAGLGVAHADSYADTIAVFSKAGESAGFFRRSYAYAVFPTVGEGGFIVGAAIGKGRVYSHHRLLGDTTMTQLSAGFQAGGKAYNQIIFFENKAALDIFRNGKFEFSAGASATAITASAGASVGTTGTTSNASGTANNATTAGGYVNGMAVFTIAKGGLMYAATLAGQKYSYVPRGAKQTAAEP
jgi:lipid-binding SYLF domain-containing protein